MAHTQTKREDTAKTTTTIAPPSRSDMTLEQREFYDNALQLFDEERISGALAPAQEALQREVISEARTLENNSDLNRQLNEAFVDFLADEHISMEEFIDLTSEERIAMINKFGHGAPGNPYFGTQEIPAIGDNIVWDFTEQNPEFGLFYAFGSFGYSFDRNTGELSIDIAFRSEARSLHIDAEETDEAAMERSVSNIFTELATIARQTIVLSTASAERSGLQFSSELWQNIGTVAQQRISELFQERVSYSGGTETQPTSLDSVPRRNLPLEFTADGTMSWPTGVEYKAEATF